MRLLLASLILLLSAQYAIAADDPPAEPPSEAVQEVVVPGVKNPELRSYLSMLAGLDEFEKKHHLAPRADTLRFHLRSRHAGETIGGLALRIASSEVSIPVPIAADGTFVLPRDKAAADSEADLILNRPKRAWSGMPRVRSANVPSNMRRLGDIRLECQVSIAIAKHELNFALRAAISAILVGSDWCQSKRIDFGTDAPYPSDSITLVHGERRLVSKVTSRRKNYFPVPIHDTSWPDDTLIEFQPSAPPTVAHYSTEPIYLQGSMNKWGLTAPLQKIDATNFRVEAVLTKGINRFKIASKGYAMVDLGAGDVKANETKGNFKPGDTKPLAWAGPDIWFEPPQPGTYIFALNVADPAAPVLTITARE
jgi:hypothetical protein